MARTPRITQSTAIVLEALVRGCRYGFDIMDVTGQAAGTVYPILRRLEKARLVLGAWEEASIAHDDGRPSRKYYELSAEVRSFLRPQREPGVGEVPVEAEDAFDPLPAHEGE